MIISSTTLITLSLFTNYLPETITPEAITSVLEFEFSQTPTLTTSFNVESFGTVSLVPLPPTTTQVSVIYSTAITTATASAPVVQTSLVQVSCTNCLTPAAPLSSSVQFFYTHTPISVESYNVPSVGTISFFPHPSPSLPLPSNMYQPPAQFFPIQPQEISPPLTTLTLTPPSCINCKAETITVAATNDGGLYLVSKIRDPLTSTMVSTGPVSYVTNTIQNTSSATVPTTLTQSITETSYETKTTPTFTYLTNTMSITLTPLPVTLQETSSTTLSVYSTFIEKSSITNTQSITTTVNEISYSMLNNYILTSKYITVSQIISPPPSLPSLAIPTPDLMHVLPNQLQFPPSASPSSVSICSTCQTISKTAEVIATSTRLPTTEIISLLGML